MTLDVPFRSLPLRQSDVRYAHGPDSYRRPDVPSGRTVEFDWDDSAIYPGTSRKFWVHLPAQYHPSRPAALVVFLDGQRYLDPEGDDRHVTFLLTEIIPRLTRRYSITEDADQWTVCGGSSGGNAAFTAAWLRPDTFGRVVCFLSSFVQMPDGNPYLELIAGVPRKPLRIFMQAGHRDLHWNEPQRNWFASNLRVAAALAEAGYDFRLVVGDGGHNPNHGGVLLPDALRWLCQPAGGEQ